MALHDYAVWSTGAPNERVTEDEFVQLLDEVVASARSGQMAVRALTDDEVALVRGLAEPSPPAAVVPAPPRGPRLSAWECARTSNDVTLEGWSRALEFRDRETDGHARRVTALTLHLAEILDIPESERVHIRRGALLHDIGKMAIPDSILLKPGALTPQEWDTMRLHPVYAYELLSPIAHLRPALDIPYCHHERWDGSGYPRGLQGEEVPLAARAFMLADVWDALRSNRPYRLAWPGPRTVEFIRGNAGVLFDPEIVKVFLPLVPY